MATERVGADAALPAGAPAAAAESTGALARFLLLHVVPHLLQEAPFAELLMALESPGPLPAELQAQLEPVPAPEAPSAAAAAAAASTDSDAADTSAAPAAGGDAPATGDAPADGAAPAAAAPPSPAAPPTSASVLAGSASSPAAVAAARSVADRDTLSHFLGSLNLSRLAPVLGAMGVGSVEGLRFLRDGDLAGLGLSGTQTRLLRGAVERWVDTMAAMLASSVGSPAAVVTSTGSGGDAGVAGGSPHHYRGSGGAGSPYGGAGAGPVSPVMARAAGVLVTQAVAASVPHRDAFGAAPSSARSDASAGADGLLFNTSSGSGSSSSALAATVPAPPPGGYDWEEYATAEGYLYYSNNATGGVQWLRPFEGSIRTLAVRAAEQAAISALVEERVRAALAAKKAKQAAEAAAAAAAAAQRRRSPSPRRGASGYSPRDGGSAVSPAAAATSSRRLISPARVQARFQHQPSSSLSTASSLKGDGRGGVVVSVHGGEPPSAGYRPAARGSEPQWRSAWGEVLAGGPAGNSSSSDGADGGGAAAGGSPTGRSFLAAQAAALAASPTAGDDAGGRQPGSGGIKVSPTSDRVISSYLEAYREGAGGSDTPRGGSVQQAPPQSMSRRARGTSASASGRARRLREAYWGGGGARAAATTAGGVGGSVAGASHRSAFTSADYPEIFEGLPIMDAATADAIVRGHSFATSKRMGYADMRPDVRPSPLMRINPSEQGALALHFNAVGGPQKKADAAWASQLRGHLYAQSADPNAARTGEEMKRMWAGGGIAPSETVPSYAYRHAAATSMLDGRGSVFDRLTDVRGYVGTHRWRFDAEGRGLGLAGRENSYDAAGLMRQVTTDTVAGAPVLPSAKDLGPRPVGMGRQ
jgi:hypothetical protein